MKKVVVTGATGFIGRHSLLPLIQRGYEVHAVSLRRERPELPGIKWHKVDLLDLPQIALLLSAIRPTHLLHFAWYAVPSDYKTSDQNLPWVQASLELFRFFVASGGRRAVLAGTGFEYDDGTGYCSEMTVGGRPSSLYGICKKALGEIITRYSEQGRVSATWGRIFSLYGPYEAPPRLVPVVIRSLLAGQAARCTQGDQIRDYLHVQDVADAFVAILESDVRGAVNVASGVPIALKDIVLSLGAALGRPELVQLGAVPAPKAEAPMVVADIRRLKNEVGFTPNLALREGLKQTIDWWRAHWDWSGAE